MEQRTADEKNRSGQDRHTSRTALVEASAIWANPIDVVASEDGWPGLWVVGDGEYVVVAGVAFFAIQSANDSVDKFEGSATNFLRFVTR